MASSPDLLLFDLQRFCVHDGPGIRTVAFLKGCPLRCAWCQNPESLRREPELSFHAARCAGCMACAQACPHGAITRGPERVDRDECQACGACAQACPDKALRLVGWCEEPAELLPRLLADRTYHQASGGGLTLSGGEPLLQAEAVAALLDLCKEAGVHTFVETCGAVPWSAFEKVLGLADAFYFDLKAAGDELHRSLTGAPAMSIADNARRLVEAGADVRFRMPVIPGHNDTGACIEGIAALLRELGHSELRLMRFHPGGEAKIPRVASQQRPLDIGREQAAASLAATRGRFTALGIATVVEGEADQEEQRDRLSLFPPRVWELREAVQGATPSVCIERARLVTRYFKQGANRRKPMLIQKAEALAAVLQGRSATIHAGELLVGCFSSKRVGGGIFPELHGVAMAEDLLAFGSRELNPLHMEPADKRELALSVLPFWLPRFLSIRAFPLPRALGFVVDQLGGRRFLVNETGGISHFVPDYERLLSQGTRGIIANAQAAAEGCDDEDKRVFYEAVQIACQGLEALAAPYAQQARAAAEAEEDPARRAELESIAQVCERAPREPARGLHEALQSLLFAQIALNIESLDNSVSPGRLDQLLMPYYQDGLDSGRLDEQAARDLIGCFSVKLCEIVPVFSRRITRFHGGMFNGQVVVVGGVDRQGDDATNALSWIFLDAMHALRMRQPNYHARLHAQSPPGYLERIASMLRDGSGSPSLMNDEAVLPMLLGRGTSLADARDYSPVGCVEPVACGSSYASTDAAIANLALCLEWTLGTRKGGAQEPSLAGCDSAEALAGRFCAQVQRLVALLVDDLQHIERANARFHPTPLSSALIDGCLQSGRDASAGGARYNGSGIQGVGVADVADSLAAIERVVFREQRCDLPTLARALRADFRGHEQLRARLLAAPKYGNDDPAADGWALLVMDAFATALSQHQNTRGGPYQAGFYSVTSHRAFGETTGALPSGRLAGQPLANGISPANGRDRLGPTATLNSIAGLDHARLARNGVNANLKIDPAVLAGPPGLEALGGLVRGYFAQGGMQLQLNVLDPKLLLAARDDPALYPWLLVRVSGYSSYFNDLSPGMKQEIIDRTLHAAP